MPDVAYVVGGGPSLYGFDFEKLRGRHCFICNKAIFDVPWADAFVTIDYTMLKKLGSKYERFQHTNTVPKFFVAGMDVGYITEENGRIVDTRSRLIYDLSDFDVIIKSRRGSGIGLHFGDFVNGHNSGFCALQLAVLFGHREIKLLGIDFNFVGTQTHYHKGYKQSEQEFNKQLEAMYPLFVDGLAACAAAGISVTSCSKASRLVIDGHVEYKEFES